MKRYSKIDLNTLLLGFNYILLIATFIFYAFFDLPSVLNITSLVIYFFLVIQAQFFLYKEKRARDPFILLFVFNLSFFYFPRFITLSLFDDYSSSGVLHRLNTATAGEINYALLFIFVANFLIYLGLKLPKSFSQGKGIRAYSNEETNLNYAIHPLVPVSLMLIIIISSVHLVFFVGGGRGDSGSEVGLLWHYLSVVFNSNIALLVVFFWFFSNKPNHLYKRSFRKLIISKTNLYRKLILLLLLMFVAMRTLVGSRSGMFQVLLAFLFCALVAGKTALEKRYLVYAVVLVLASVIIFSIATYSRSLLSTQEVTVDAYEFLDPLVDFVFKDEPLFGAQSVLVPVFDRIAYLDFSVDIIRNSSSYGEIINFPFYAMSLVDNNSPGLTIFDVPRAASGLIHVYSSVPLTAHPDFYQADQFSIYGEYYVLFQGWFSLPAFFVGAFVFKAVYLSIKTKNLLNKFAIKIFVVLQFYYTWLNSFGTDWMIIEITRMGVLLFVVLYAINYLSKRPVKRSPYASLSE